LAQASQVRKAVNPGAVTIGPAWLQCVAAYQIETGELEALPGVNQVRARDVAEQVRLASARRARTRASQKLKSEIRLHSVAPMNRQLVSDLLDVRRFQAHISILAGYRS